MDLLLSTLAAFAALGSAGGGAVGTSVGASAAPPAATVGTAGSVGDYDWADAKLRAPPTGAAAPRLIGASASFTVSARIVTDSARIGAGIAPPNARMVARAATIAAADGRPVPALIYDFE